MREGADEIYSTVERMESGIKVMTTAFTSSSLNMAVYDGEIMVLLTILYLRY